MPMVNKDVEQVLTIAREVIELGTEVVKDNNRVSNAHLHYGDEISTEYAYPNGKLRAALRRRSMDLTRALAEMRKW